MKQGSKRYARPSTKRGASLDTVLFDLDGTLYEDVALYTRYAQELGKFLPERLRERFFADWGASQRGEGTVRLGLGYDDEIGRLFRYESGCIVAYLDWEGGEQAQPPTSPESQPTHVLFEERRLSVGDWWGVLRVLAARYGVTTEQRNAAFTATREFMATEDWQPSVEHDLLETLDMLQQRRVSLVAMTNSPAATTADVLERLGLAEVFPVVIASAQKPAGLARFIAEHGPACRYLAVGDHYVNDIEPVLEAGGRALYIDRHRTGLGAGHPKLERVRSIREVPARLWADFDWPGRA